MSTVLSPIFTQSLLNKSRFVEIDGNSKRVYSVDEAFSRLEKNLNDFYGTDYKLQ